MFKINNGLKESRQVEDKLKAIFGVEYPIFMTSGHAALTSALIGLGIGPGDQVIVPAYTYISTAMAVVAAGAILQSALEQKGIYIGTHISKCAGVCDRNFDNYQNDIKELHKAQFPILDADVKEQMLRRMIEIKELDDSVGGIMETAIVGVPAGVGEPWFDNLESLLSHAMFSIPAIKGVEFGIGFGCAYIMGSQMNDEFYVDGNEIHTRSNNNGGINGGISNGMPIMFKCAVKPTSSIARKQKTVNFIDMKDTEIEIQGRHDATIIPRACVVAEALSALVIADLLIGRYGTDYFLN